ncbi:MAG: lasso peptide biosynthesis B2 protein [Armatimonadota bacterium]|nr:lasso peptide biosynthesis B2 protein [Armatimonadota bacterium]
MPDRPAPLSLGDKARLAGRVLRTYVVVRVNLHRQPLPRLVARLGESPGPTGRRYAPALLSRAVHRVLRTSLTEQTCLVRALILYRLLKEQGDAPELVIGLPPHPTDHRAHAWVELDGVDLGPPPGRGLYEPFARYS